MKTTSFLSNAIEGYVKYRKASGRDSHSYIKNVILFDHFCAREYPGQIELSQEIVDRWCRQRPIPLLAKPAQCLKRYLIKYHPKQNDANALLFCSKSKGIYVPMSAENVNKMLKKYATMAHERCQDVPMDLHAHQFRHAKASHWLENGMNIAQISYLLGHESIQTTMVYLDITTKQEEKALETLEGENQKKMRKKWKTEEGKANLEILLGLTKTN